MLSEAEASLRERAEVRTPAREIPRLRCAPLGMTEAADA